MKRIISIIMVTLLTVMTALANIAEGVSGDCNWVIDNDGNLIISSVNEDCDIADLGTWVGDSAPWSSYRDSITTVVFSSPVNAKTCTYKKRSSLHYPIIKKSFSISIIEITN